MAHESGMVRLHLSDLDWATGLLTEAFLHEAPTTHLFLGSSRQAQVEYFMRCSCRYALLFGECYTNADRTGVALWLLPNNTTMTPGRMYRAGMLSAPFRMGLPAFSRFMGFAGHTDTLHRVAAPMPHYYLFALGVSPSSQGQGIGRRLVSGMLDRADDEQMPAYLETQSPRNVPLYERLGFERTIEAPFPKLQGLNNWGMVRRPSGANAPAQASEAR